MPGGSREKKRDTKRSHVSELSDDLLVEIISRVPYKSTRCCKCVCRRWRDLVSHPDHRKKLPWSTLASFFYRISKITSKPYTDRGYQSLSGNWRPQIDPSLSFLPGCDGEGTDIIDLLDCCNGLLLCCRSKRKGPYPKKIVDYVVCNPATEKWVAMPATEWSNKVWDARLGFDPTISSHFHVFELVPTSVWIAGEKQGGKRIKTVRIYSSKAGVWTYPSVWDRPINIRKNVGSVFFNGVMYLSSYGDLRISAVDLEGNRKVIPIPMPHEDSYDFDVYLSRGKLYLANYGVFELSIWALEDSSSENWTLKHKVSHLQLIGKEYLSIEDTYSVIIHPEHSVIFLVPRWSSRTLTSYDMDSREASLICDLELGCRPPYLQYVPFFSESLADGH